MFGFLKSKRAPEGPVEFDVAAEIERPASEIYALIDWADPRNAKRALGHSVEPLDGEPQRYRLVMAGMPDLRFDMTVTEAVPNERYAFATGITPPVGRLDSSSEHYSVEPIGDDRCKLKLTVVATFNKGLSMKQFERELAMMTVSCQRAVAKLKIHAEHGADAVRAVEARL